MISDGSRDTEHWRNPENVAIYLTEVPFQSLQGTSGLDYIPLLPSVMT